MFNLGRQLRSLLEVKDMAAGDLLREFLLATKHLPTLPGRMVWRMLYFSETPTFPSHELKVETGTKGSGRKRQVSKSLEPSASGRGGLSDRKRRRQPDVPL